MKFISLALLSLYSIWAGLYAQDSLQNYYIKIPDGISVDGVPPLSATLIESIKPYTFARFSYLQDWHPLKKEMLINTQLGNTIQSYVVKMPGGMRRQVTFYDEPINQSLFDRKKGNYIIVQKDNNGDEFYQIYRHDLSTGKSELLSDGGKSYNFNLGWNKKGDKLFFTSLTSNESNRKIYILDPDKPDSKQLFLNLEGPNWHVQDMSADESKLLLSMPYEGSNSENSLWLYDVKSKDKKILLPAKGKKGSYSSIGSTNDGSGFYLLTNQDSEFTQLAFYNYKNHELNILTHFNWNIRSASLSPDETKIAFIVNEEGISKTYIYYTAGKTYKPIQGLPVGYLSSIGWLKDSQSLAFQLSTSYAICDIYEFNTKTSKLIPWVQNEIGGIDASAIPAPRLIKWKSFDGLIISGFLYPASKRFTGKRPVIIDIHGGPVSQALPFYYSNVNYYTNELGISVIFPNIRGSNGFGKVFTELDNGIKKEDALKDIGSLLDWIASRPDLDADRVMVTGGSYGGYMTYRTAIAYNSKIRCAVEAFGISDMLSYKKNVDTAYREYFTSEFGDLNDQTIRNYFDRISPLKNANKLTMPIFIIQGRNDPRIPFTESQQMVEAIKKNGGKVWYLLANDEGHGFSKQSNQDYLFYATIEFIKRYLIN